MIFLIHDNNIIAACLFFQYTRDSENFRYVDNNFVYGLDTMLMRLEIFTDIQFVVFTVVTDLLHVIEDRRAKEKKAKDRTAKDRRATHK